MANKPWRDFQGHFQVVSGQNFFIGTVIRNIPMVAAGFSGSLSHYDEQSLSPCHQPEMDLQQDLRILNLFLLKSLRICGCLLM